MITGSGGAGELPARDEVAEVMSRPEFQYPRSIPERIGEWFAERLDDLFNRVPDSGGTEVVAPGAGLGSLVGWVLVVLAVVVVVVVVVLVVRRWVPRPDDDDGEESTIDTEHRRPAHEWRNEAERLEAGGEWKLALRARYRELVRTLVDRAQVADVAGRTNSELAGDLRRSTPGAVEAFSTASVLFELAWYAGLPTGAEENRRFRDAASTVLAVEPEARLDRVPVVEVGRVEVGP
ncbi:MAG: DUF4129 domain-containing protein [Microthrixaceae bacterium]|nr:DUF4129 domain-containing protein [Microthrixaceae bacterium]MCO5318755.1 DUF4129 domain-containing protein [Microthrixaceae bacterium]